jgi:hypothetical protein
MSKKSNIAGSIIGLIALLATAAFLLIGFTTGTWHPTWMLFLIIPVVSIIADIFTNKHDVAGKVTGIVAILCAVGYMAMGFFWGLWHPGWIIFFAIPISGIIVKMFSPDAGTQRENDTQPKQ